MEEMTKMNFPIKILLSSQFQNIDTINQSIKNLMQIKTSEKNCTAYTSATGLAKYMTWEVLLTEIRFQTPIMHLKK